MQAIGTEGAANLDGVADSVGGLYNAMSTAIGTSTDDATGLINSVGDGAISPESIHIAVNNVQIGGNNIVSSINNMDAAFNGVYNNPVLYMKSIIAVAGTEGLDLAKSYVIAAPLAKGMTIKHFGNNAIKADEALKSLGVKNGLSGMNFNRSTIFSSDSPNEIHLAVYYRLKLFSFFKWADLEVAMCKESRARAWLGGDDVSRLATASSSVSTPSEDGDGSAGTEVDEDSDEDSGEEENEDSDSSEDDSSPDEIDIALDELEKANPDVEALREIVGMYNERGKTDLQDVITIANWAIEYGISFDELGLKKEDGSTWKLSDELSDGSGLTIQQKLDSENEGGKNSILDNIEVVITEQDWKYVEDWKFRPSKELYTKYKNVYQNPEFFNPKTGDVIWPPNSGFVQETRKFEVLTQGKVFKRIGEPSGEFLGTATDSFEMRSLAPFSDPALNNVSERYYRLLEDSTFESGEIAPWFGQDGGGYQFLKYKPDGNAYTVQELLDADIIEDITDLVEKGEIIID